MVEMIANSSTIIPPSLDLERMLAALTKLKTYGEMNPENMQTFAMLSALPMYGTSAWDIFMK